jgi:HSP20 family protein
MILRSIPSFQGWPLAFGELDEMRRSMDRLFDSLVESTGLQMAGVYPALNLSQDADSVHVRAELPGVKADDLVITMENDTLTIAGERAMPVEHDDRVSYHRREREWGKFRRSLAIPVHVDSDHVEAHYRDGILTVTLAKAPHARPKQIAVQAEA